MQETQVMWVRSLNWEEEEVASHSSVLLGKIPWTEEPDLIQRTSNAEAVRELERVQVQCWDVALEGTIYQRKRRALQNRAQSTWLSDPESRAHQGHMYFASLESDYNYNVIIFNIIKFPCQLNFPSKLLLVEYDLDIILLRPAYSMRLTNFSTFKTSAA